MSVNDITGLIQRWQSGDLQAQEQLIPLLYDELRRLARQQMRRERAGHTLQTTALVHEAYLRAAGMDASLANRSHFLALIARVMRQVLVDHARSRQRDKRGGDAPHISFDDELELGQKDDVGFLELDDALSRLGQIDGRKEEIVVSHYFGGLNQTDIAEVIGVSRATVERDLKFARAWLAVELNSS